MMRPVATLAAFALLGAVAAHANEPTASLPETLGFDVIGGEVRLVWDSVPAATGYLVETKLADGTFRALGDVAVAQPWMDVAPSLKPDARGYFRVVSISGGVKSAPSRAVSFFRKRVIQRAMLHPNGLMMAPAVDRRDEAIGAAAPAIASGVAGAVAAASTPVIAGVVIGGALGYLLFN